MTGTGTYKTVLKGIALASALTLGGCGSSSSLFSSSPLDFFKTSSKATSGTAPAEGEAKLDVECPGVEVRTGASTLMIGSKPGEGEPAALDLRYQGTIIRTARECQVNAGVMSLKVGIEGRVITGPAGGPGVVDVPLRIVVVQEGPSPKPIVSKFAHVQVTVNSAIDRVTFNHVEPDVSFPMPTRLADIDAYVIYVGFDPVSEPPKKEKPVAKKPKPKAVAKPKLS